VATESQYVFALEVLTTPPGVPIPQGVGDGADRVITASRNWVSGTNVVGTGVSIKQTAGTSVPDQWAFKVYVKKKLANNEIPDGETVPPVVEIPGIDEPIVTDVVEIGTPLLEANTMRTRPLMAGYSTGLTVGETGTIGCFVSSRDDPHTPLILSNSHVIANYGMAGAGAVVVQPGRKDGGTDADEVG
jgi:hypothetical protein